MRHLGVLIVWVLVAVACRPAFAEDGTTNALPTRADEAIYECVYKYEPKNTLDMLLSEDLFSLRQKDPAGELSSIDAITVETCFRIEAQLNPSLFEGASSHVFSEVGFWKYAVRRLYLEEREAIHSNGFIGRYETSSDDEVNRSLDAIDCAVDRDTALASRLSFEPFNRADRGEIRFDQEARLAFLALVQQCRRSMDPSLINAIVLEAPVLVADSFVKRSKYLAGRNNA